MACRAARSSRVVGRIAPVRGRWRLALGSPRTSRRAGASGSVVGGLPHGPPAVALLRGLVPLSEPCLLPDLGPRDARGALDRGVIGDLAVGAHDLVVASPARLGSEHVADRGAQHERLHPSSPPTARPAVAAIFPQFATPCRAVA